MQRQPFDAETLKTLVHYDPKTGVMRRFDGRSVFVDSHQGYARTFFGNRGYLVHRLAWLYMTGEWPKGQIDHRNGDRCDNRWRNLRDATASINAQNQRSAHCGSKTQALGVGEVYVASVYGRRKYRARISIEGKTHYIGTFDTKQQAQDAYVATKRRLHEGCTL